jgi:hypothetical protein
MTALFNAGALFIMYRESLEAVVVVSRVVGHAKNGCFSTGYALSDRQLEDTNYLSRLLCRV